MMNPARTVLCIDDEEPAARLRKLVLESAGYNVLTALSGKAGVQAFKSHAVDVVVLDYWMADMNGLAVAKEVKRLNRDTPVIMLSAYTPLLDEAIGLADEWIRKGEEGPDYLLEKIEKLLSRRKVS